jgi:hypothetical protein
MPTRLEHPPRFLHRRHTCRMYVWDRGLDFPQSFEEWVVHQQPDAQCTGRRPDLFTIRSARGWGDEQVAGHGTRHDIQNGRGVSDRPRQHILADIAEQSATVGRPQGYAPPRGFEAHQPTTTGRYANRARPIVAMCDRHHPSGDRCGRAAAGAASGARGVKGIAGRPKGHRIRHGATR